MMPLKACRAAMRGTLAAAGALAALVLIAGCQGRGPNEGSGKLQVNLVPILQQLGGAGGGHSGQSATGARTGELATPPASDAVTPVLTLVVGAIVIDFRDTPIGSDTAITDTVRNQLKKAATNSVQFLSLVQLPTGISLADFDAPPPGATHWQVTVVGLRDSVTSFDAIGDKSAIYYGFNSDANGKPFFVSQAMVGSTPFNVHLGRACMVSQPPNGCAQFQPDGSFVATPAMEIVGLYVNGGANLLNQTIVARADGSTTDCTAGPCDGTAAALAMVATLTPAPGDKVLVDTTHQLSAEYSAESPCTPVLGTTQGDGGTTGCSIETYTTQY